MESHINHIISGEKKKTETSQESERERKKNNAQFMSQVHLKKFNNFTDKFM